MKFQSSAILALAFGAAFLACSDAPVAGPRPANTPRPGAPTAPAAAGAAAPVKAALVPYAYNPTAKRDPFRPPDEVRARRNEAGPGECNEPLCQWDLDQLSLKAVVTGDANPFAMLVDPQGRGYIVRRNTRVGRQGGRVTQILRDQVTVTEFWTRPDGKRDQMPKVLGIAEEKGLLTDVDLITGKTVP